MTIHDSTTRASKIIAGWRDGRPVLDSLAAEQEAVADVFDVLHSALVEIADVPGRSVTSIIARRALDGKR